MSAGNFGIFEKFQCDGFVTNLLFHNLKQVYESIILLNGTCSVAVEIPVLFGSKDGWKWIQNPGFSVQRNQYYRIAWSRYERTKTEPSTGPRPTKFTAHKLWLIRDFLLWVHFLENPYILEDTCIEPYFTEFKQLDNKILSILKSKFQNFSLRLIPIRNKAFLSLCKLCHTFRFVWCH